MDPPQSPHGDGWRIRRRSATHPHHRGAGEGLLIMGWVVLWRPAELLLFERWENRRERRVLDRLARIPVEFAVLPGDRP